MEKYKLTSILKIAEIHAKRLRYAIAHLQSQIPISAETFEALSDEDLLIFELYASRFTKLQDFMGSTIFSAALSEAQELEDQMTLLDKLHKLEKVGLIVSAEEWIKMRKIRNKLTHEYPDNPELTATFFNEAYYMGNQLLENLQLLSQFINNKTK